jgi:hypothetical protein
MAALNWGNSACSIFDRLQAHNLVLRHSAVKAVFAQRVDCGYGFTGSGHVDVVEVTSLGAHMPALVALELRCEGIKGSAGLQSLSRLTSLLLARMVGDNDEVAKTGWLGVRHPPAGPALAAHMGS